MGSLTRASLATLPGLVAGAKGASVAEVFYAGRVCASSASLTRALGDDSAVDTQKTQAVDEVFHQVTPGTRALLGSLVGLTWSEPTDLLHGIEEAGIRLAAITTGKTDLAGELLAVDRTIKSQPDVQLALSGKRAPAEGKIAMVEALFGTKVSPEALAIVSHLVAQPRDRRITQSVAKAAETVCDQRGEGLAEVRVANSLAPGQLATISSMLDKQYGRPHYLDEVVDPQMLGGIRIRVGDHVIDQSVATQLADMRRQLAS